jgi:hypothetical protein
MSWNINSTSFWLILAGTGILIISTAVAIETSTRKRRKRRKSKSKFHRYTNLPTESHGIALKEFVGSEDLVGKCVESLLASHASVGSDYFSNRKTSSIPPCTFIFVVNVTVPEHVEYLLSEFKSAKRTKRVLLIEGGQGIGKGTALQVSLNTLTFSIGWLKKGRFVLQSTFQFQKS